MKEPQPIDNPIPPGECWFEVYNPYEHLEAEPPKALPVALDAEEEKALRRKRATQTRRMEREAARASPYVQVNLKANRALQKKLKAIFDE